MVKDTNYIKIYKQHLNINWDAKKYQIHHIDGNRKNNDILNLVLLPKTLHQKLHSTKSKITVEVYENVLNLENFSFMFCFDDIVDYLDIKRDVWSYIQLRNMFLFSNIDIKNYEKELERMPR